MHKTSSHLNKTTTRLPAEFEPVQRVFLCEPHAPDTWYHVFDDAFNEFRLFRDALQKIVPVVDLHADWKLNTRDSWIRDYGPIFTEEHGGTQSIQDFRFNGWGEVYDESYHQDDRITAEIARRLNLPCQRHEWVLEAGAIDSNGQKALLLSEDCLLDPARNPEMTRHAVEVYLSDYLGIQHFHWISGVITGDDTSGHVDELARFIDPNTIVIATTMTAHPDWHTRQHLCEQVHDFKTIDGSPYRVIELPCPAPRVFDYPDTHAWETQHPHVPMSYTNFLMVNQHLFLPTFKDPNDRIALETFQAALPEFTIVPINSHALAVGRGSLHCLSLTQPALTELHA